jgi:hypothetical protein
MKKIYIFLLLALAGVLFLVLYNNLGGFNEIVIEQEELKEIKLIGKYFRGTPIDASLGKTFIDVQNQANEQTGGVFYTLYYKEPAGKTDTLHVFVGIEASNLSSFATNSNWDSLVFPKSTALIATLEAHPLVMPDPNKVKNKIKAYVKNNGLKAPMYFLDKIESKNRVKVIALPH